MNSMNFEPCPCLAHAPRPRAHRKNLCRSGNGLRPPPHSNNTRMPKWTKGAKVEGQDEDGQWYPGTIGTVHRDGTYRVNWQGKWHTGLRGTSMVMCNHVLAHGIHHVQACT